MTKRRWRVATWRSQCGDSLISMYPNIFLVLLARPEEEDFKACRDILRSVILPINKETLASFHVWQCAIPLALPHAAFLLGGSFNAKKSRCRICTDDKSLVWVVKECKR